MTGAPGAAMNKYHDRRFRVRGRIDIQHLVRRRPVGDTPGRTETGADQLAFAGAALVELIAIWRVDRLVVGVVKLFLIHVKPDAGPLGARRGLLCNGAGRNHGGGSGANDGPAAHQISFAAIAVHRTSGVSRAVEAAHNSRRTKY